MPTLIARDPAIVGYCEVGYFRVGVLTSKWEMLINAYGCRALTHRIASNPSADPTSGLPTTVLTDETMYGIPVPSGGTLPPFASALGVRMQGALTVIGFPLYQAFKATNRIYDPLTRHEYVVENVQTIFDPATYYDGTGAEVTSLAFYAIHCKLIETTSQIGGPL